MACLLLKLNPNLKLNSKFKEYSKGFDSFQGGFKAFVGVSFLAKSYNLVKPVNFIFYSDGIHRAEL